MSKYPWADNQQKLQRAIEKANIEHLPGKEKTARIKELYVSFGGKLVELEENNIENNMNEEETTGTEVEVKVGETTGTEEGLDVSTTENATEGTETVVEETTPNNSEETEDAVV